jgi:uncharacterized membrane protein SpoIIM required for sporulation
MKVADLLEQRRANWRELEELCLQVEGQSKRKLGAVQVTRFASLYRSACADLALADSYQLPPNTVQYLHRLVGRAHNQLYRSHDVDYANWSQVMLVDTPRRIFQDRCVQLCFFLFWGSFVLSAILAYSPTVWPNYAEQMISQNQIDQMEEMFGQPIAGRSSEANFAMAGFYIQHNTSIGLKCFAGGILVIPGLFITIFNAVFLGAAFGYMARPEVAAGANFFHFVTAHGPFELTAIALSAGAGLRLGVSWIATGGLTRTAALREAARQALPIMFTAMVLFLLAAMIEGFLSPSAAPYWLKAAVAVLSSGMLTFYFLILGFPRRS